jgi:hypothetical protein
MEMKTIIVYFISFCILAVASTDTLLAFQNQKNRVRLYLTYVKKSPTDRYLNIKATTRKDGKNVPAEAVKIELYLNEKTDASLLGSIITDMEGLGHLVLPNKFYDAAGHLHRFNFIASLHGDPNYSDTDRALEIKESEIEIELIDQDSLKWIQVKVVEKDTVQDYIAKAGVDLNFLVERPLCFLPIAELISSDEDGMAVVPFPSDLPGDSEGDLIIVVKIDDHEEYGTLESKVVASWGIPTLFDDKSIKRSLWAAGANAPLTLMFLVNGLIAAAWGIMFYIIYAIYKISKL